MEDTIMNAVGRAKVPAKINTVEFDRDEDYESALASYVSSRIIIFTPD